MTLRLSRLVPRSLRVQMMLLILGTVLLVQAATFATLSLSWQSFSREVAVDLTATTIRTLRSALVAVPEGRRADFVNESSGGRWRLWSRSLPSHTRLEHSRKARHRQLDRAPHRPPRNDVRRVLRSFVDTLNDELDDDTRVALSHGKDPRLYISLTGEPEALPHNRDWLVIPLDRVAPPLSTPIIAFWLGGMGLFLLLAAGFSWHITRPLTQLAEAADQLAAGQPQRVTPTGPRETRVLGERFNLMLDTLAESDAVQRTLLAGLPHDLKGPLSRMWLRAEMLEDAALQDGMRKDIQDMQQMLDQFIGFARGADPASYQLEPMDIHAWLDEKTASWQSAGKDVRFQDGSSGPVTIRADVLALDRLVDNLITNALTHGKEPVEISLAVAGQTACLTVADHGPGIQADRQAEALRPFSRLDDARTRTGSVGLGLALADAIARGHGGSLRLDPDATHGLCVRITFPLAGTAGPNTPAG